MVCYRLKFTFTFFWKELYIRQPVDKENRLGNAAFHSHVGNVEVVFRCGNFSFMGAVIFYFLQRTKQQMQTIRDTTLLGGKTVVS